MSNTVLVCEYCWRDIDSFPYVTGNDLKFCSEICANRFYIAHLFIGRCALNSSHSMDAIHEIVPRSVRVDDWWSLDNMVPLCNNCHGKIHREGTKKYRDQLRKILREKYAAN